MALLFDSVQKADNSLEYIGTESVIVPNESFESINYIESILCNFKATYEGCKCDSVEIMYEGFTDMIHDLKQWFIDWLKRFKEFVSRKFEEMKKYLKYLLYHSKRVSDFDAQFKGSFSVKGFHYDLDDKVDLWIIGDMISRIDKATDAVENAGVNVAPALTKALNEVGSMELFNKYRGIMLGKPFVSQGEYIKMLDMQFRGGKSEPVDIKIDSAYLKTIQKEAKGLNFLLNECYKEKDIIERSVKEILNSLNKRPKFVAETNKNGAGDSDKYISAREINAAITSIYNRSAASLRTVLLICDQFYNRKITAISEALRFYNSCFSKSISSYNSQVKESVFQEETYLDMIEEEFSDINMDYEDDIIDDCTLELFVYLNAFEAKEIAMEEASGKVQIGANNKPITQRRVRGIGNRLADLGRRILNFITNMITKFDRALGDILKTDVEWVRANAHYITDMPAEVVNTLTIHYSNYIHTDAHARILEKGLPGNVDLARMVEDIGKSAKTAYSINKGKDFNGARECYRKYFRQLSTIDPNDWKSAAIMYYRGRSKGNIVRRDNTGQAETVTARGKEAVTVLNEMVKFCLNYKNYANSAKNTVNGLKNAVTKLDSHLNQLSSLRSQINEGFGYDNIDPMPYSVLEDVFVIKEALGDTSTNVTNPSASQGNVQPTGANANTPQQTGVRNTVATATTNRNNTNMNNLDPNTRNKIVQNTNEYIDTRSFAAEQIRSAYMICTSIISAKLTVCEEIMRSYMRILHGVVDGIRKYQGNAEEDRSNAQYNDRKENEKHEDWMDRRREIQRRNTLRKERRTGLYGALKNVIGG